MFKTYVFATVLFFILLLPISMAALTTSATFYYYKPDGSSACYTQDNYGDAYCVLVSCTISGSDATCEHTFYDCTQEGWYKGHVVYSHGGTNSDGTPLDPNTQTERYPISGEQNLYYCEKTPPTGSLSGVPLNWQNTDASITLTCSDDYSGCNSNEDYYYLDTDSSCPAFSASTYSAYTSAVTVNSYKWFCYSIADNAGNRYTTTTGTEIKVDKTPPTVSSSGAAFSPCTSDPITTWIDCSATASVSCGDADSGCNPNSYGYKLYDTNPGTCPSTKSSYTIGTSVTITKHVWVCTYAEDNVGNPAVSSPVEFKVDKTFTFNITAKIYDDKGYVMKNELVSVYLCNNNVVFCNGDVQYITKGSAVSSAQGWFTVILAAELEKGVDYKIGVVTSKGYAESVVKT